MAARQERLPMRTNFASRIDWDHVDEDYPMGEIPPGDMPGTLTFELPQEKRTKGSKNTLLTEKEVLTEAKKRGPLRKFIRALRHQRMHVTVAGLRGAREVVLFVASSQAVVGRLPRLRPPRKKA